jgi:hypothetical protein
MIPAITKETIDWYITKKAKPGGFVEACLAYDFIRSIQVADCDNMRAMKYIVDYILEFVPDEAKGNYQKVDLWLREIE